MPFTYGGFDEGSTSVLQGRTFARNTVLIPFNAAATVDLLFDPRSIRVVTRSLRSQATVNEYSSQFFVGSVYTTGTQLPHYNQNVDLANLVASRSVSFFAPSLSFAGFPGSQTIHYGTVQAGESQFPDSQELLQGSALPNNVVMLRFVNRTAQNGVLNVYFRFSEYY